MAVSSTWLVGSSTISATNLVVGGFAHAVAGGTYYLYDATAGLSLIKQVENAIAAQVPGSTVRILQNRKVKIDFNGSSTAITIPSAIATLLGFTGSPYGGATTRTAEQVSPLLWSPGWPETPTGSPVGTAGHRVYDRVMTSSPTGMSFDVTWHSYSTMVEWSWVAVMPGRSWTTAELGGEYVTFFNEVIVPGEKFKCYSQMTEDDASSSNVTWQTALGPYVCREPEYEWYQRFNSRTDALGANISINAMVTAEIT
jgi:hypothetical protein